MKVKIFFAVIFLQSTLVFSKTEEDTMRCFVCCRPDAVAPAGIMLDHVHDKGKFSLAYNFMNMSMKGNQSGTKSVSDATMFNTYMMATDRMSMQMHMLMPMYGITSRLTIMAMLTYNIYTMHMAMMPSKSMNMPGMTMVDNSSASEKMKSYGLGDTKINCLYNFLRECNQRLVGGIGLSLPTGDIDVRGETMQSDYAVFPYGMQLGTGTYDLLPSLTYVSQGRKFSRGVSANAIIKTGLNKKNYSYGNEYDISLWIMFKPSACCSFSARAEYYSMAKLYGYDKEINLTSGNDAAYNAKNYGLQKANIHLGINLYAPSGILQEGRILLEYGIPIYQDVYGIQPTLRSTLSARLQYDF